MVGARLIGVWAAATLALLAFTAATAAAKATPGGSVAFELQGTHGYSLLVLAGWNPRVPDGAVTIFVSNEKHGSAV